MRHISRSSRYVSVRAFVSIPLVLFLCQCARQIRGVSARLNVIDARLAWKTLDEARTFEQCFGVSEARLWPSEEVLSCAQHKRKPSSPSCVGENTAVLVLAYDRPAYLERALASILRHHPNRHAAEQHKGRAQWLGGESSGNRAESALCAHSFEVFVSQDLQTVSERSGQVWHVINRVRHEAMYGVRDALPIRIHHWVHDQGLDMRKSATIFPGVHGSYMRVSRHYYYALWRLFALRLTEENNVESAAHWSPEQAEASSEVFIKPCDLEITQRPLNQFPPVPSSLASLSSCDNAHIHGDVLNRSYVFDRVIVLEDDMEISSDFFEYFHRLGDVVESDPTLFTVSAWNDNGGADLAFNASTLHRTDFFPGLGWLLTRSLWGELQPKWPLLYWDDWMRNPEQTLHRQSIRPEMSRVRNFGQNGVSRGQYFEEHITQVQLNTEYIPFWTQRNQRAELVSQIQRENYRKEFYTRLTHATRVRSPSHLRKHAPRDADIVLEYKSFNALTKHLGLLGDERDGVRRGSYENIVVFGYNHRYWGFAVPRNRSLLSRMPEWASIGSNLDDGGGARSR